MVRKHLLYKLSYLWDVFIGASWTAFRLKGWMNIVAVDTSQHTNVGTFENGQYFLFWMWILHGTNYNSRVGCVLPFSSKCRSSICFAGSKMWTPMCLLAGNHGILTHLGRVMHICISKLTIGSDNGLLPGRRQVIIWINAGILLIGHLGTNYNEILIEI